MVTLDVPPKQLAKASAWGMLIGVSPYLGFQTYMAVAVASYFNLPIYPLIIGVYITNPITIPFIYAFTTKVGMMLFGMESVNIDWANISFFDILSAGKSLILPFLVGTHFVGLVSAIITYFIVLFIATRYQKRKALVEAEASEANNNNE